jgi:hypothetical protein
MFLCRAIVVRRCAMSLPFPDLEGVGGESATPPRSTAGDDAQARAALLVAPPSPRALRSRSPSPSPLPSPSLSPPSFPGSAASPSGGAVAHAQAQAVFPHQTQAHLQPPPAIKSALKTSNAPSPVASTGNTSRPAATSAASAATSNPVSVRFIAAPVQRAYSVVADVLGRDVVEHLHALASRTGLVTDAHGSSAAGKSGDAHSTGAVHTSAEADLDDAFASSPPSESVLSRSPNRRGVLHHKTVSPDGAEATRAKSEADACVETNPRNAVALFAHLLLMVCSAQSGANGSRKARAGTSDKQGIIECVEHDDFHGCDGAHIARVECDSHTHTHTHIQRAGMHLGVVQAPPIQAVVDRKRNNKADVPQPANSRPSCRICA